MTVKTFDQNIRYYRHLIEVIERKTNIQNNFFFLIKLFVHLFDDQTGIILKLLLIKFSIFFRSSDVSAIFFRPNQFQIGKKN